MPQPLSRELQLNQFRALVTAAPKSIRYAVRLAWLLVPITIADSYLHARIFHPERPINYFYFAFTLSLGFLAAGLYYRRPAQFILLAIYTAVLAFSGALVTLTYFLRSLLFLQGINRFIPLDAYRAPTAFLKLLLSALLLLSLFWPTTLRHLWPRPTPSPFTIPPPPPPST